MTWLDTHLVRSHEWIDKRSLALHEAVAGNLEADPPLVNVAPANLQRWLGTDPRPALLEWRQLLDAAPLPQLFGLLRSSGAHAAR